MSGRFSQVKNSLPKLGLGLGLRSPIAEKIFENRDKIDWLEFCPENHIGVGGLARDQLEQASKLFPLVSHGLTLSIGGVDELNYDYLAHLKEIIERYDCPWWSDHLSFTTYGGKYIHDLIPISFSVEAVKHISERIQRACQFIGRPFLIENISYYMSMPGSQMTESQFLSEILETADCGLLLDVNNLFVNASNLIYDPVAFLNEIPLERVVEIHIAGHQKESDFVLDTHGAAIAAPVYELLNYVLGLTEVKAILLERDQSFPDFEEIILELAKIRELVEQRKTPDSRPYRTPQDRTKGPPDVGGALFELGTVQQQVFQLLAYKNVRQNVEPETATPLSNVSRKGIERYSTLISQRNQSVLSTTYPITSKLLSADWSELCIDYLERFPPTHFNLIQMGVNLAEYIEKCRSDLLNRHPFLSELVTYEWLEVTVAEDPTPIIVSASHAITKAENLKNLSPRLNPTAQLRRFQYPVHYIIQELSENERLPNDAGAADQAFALVVYRHPQDQKTRSVELGDGTIILIESLKTSARSYSYLLQELREFFPETSPDELRPAFQLLIQELQAQYLLIGEEPVQGG